MIGAYFQAVSQSLTNTMDTLARFAIPIAIIIGLSVLAAGLSIVLQREGSWVARADWRRLAAAVAGAATVLFVLIVGISGLRAALPAARESAAWRDSAAATSNPVPDAPPVTQYGPSIAVIKERTYTRTLTLPRGFMVRVEEQGLGALAPYLGEPYAQNVLRLTDAFQQKGEDVVFTRSVTRRDEEPISAAGAKVRVKFKRLSGRAYDADFSAAYTFVNEGSEEAETRFLLPVPQAGTVRDLNVTVSGQLVAEPNSSGVYEWTGKLGPGQKCEAVVHYRVLGARTWQYSLGSMRRRATQFEMEVEPEGPVRYLRGSIQPSAASTQTLRWTLSNVITAQQIALSLPEESEGSQSYLQALSALPAALVMFVIGVITVGIRSRRLARADRLAAGAALFAFGLGSAVVLSNYVGPLVGLILGPVFGALMVPMALGPRALLSSVPAALVPAAFISPHHSGLVILLIGILAITAVHASGRRTSTGY